MNFACGFSLLDARHDCDSIVRVGKLWTYRAQCTVHISIGIHSAISRRTDLNLDRVTESQPRSKQLSASQQLQLQVVNLNIQQEDGPWALASCLTLTRWDLLLLLCMRAVVRDQLLKSLGRLLPSAFPSLQPCLVAGPLYNHKV